MKRKTKKKIDTPLFEWIVGPMSQLRDETLGLMITNPSDKVRYFRIYNKPFSHRVDNAKVLKKKKPLVYL